MSVAGFILRGEDGCSPQVALEGRNSATQAVDERVEKMCTDVESLWIITPV
jgi:hypothetical protein